MKILMYTMQLAPLSTSTIKTLTINYTIIQPFINKGWQVFLKVILVHNKISTTNKI